MATNVFGSPITDATLEFLPDYMGKEITRFDRAFKALDMQTSEGKAVQARAFVDKLKYDFGNGVSTKCLIYNATGEPIKYVGYRDWYGHLGEAPYPMEIANGQWGAFLHIKKPGAASGSSAGVVYRIKGRDWRADIGLANCWTVAWGMWNSNHSYAEFRSRNYFSSDNRWAAVEWNLNRTGRIWDVKSDLFQASLSIGNSTTSVWEATIKLGRP